MTCLYQTGSYFVGKEWRKTLLKICLSTWQSPEVWRGDNDPDPRGQWALLHINTSRVTCHVTQQYRDILCHVLVATDHPHPAPATYAVLCNIVIMYNHNHILLFCNVDTRHGVKCNTLVFSCARRVHVLVLPTAALCSSPPAWGRIILYTNVNISTYLHTVHTSRRGLNARFRFSEAFLVARAREG